LRTGVLAARGRVAPGEAARGDLAIRIGVEPVQAGQQVRLLREERRYWACLYITRVRVGD
jgi:hypothetical protein